MLEDYELVAPRCLSWGNEAFFCNADSAWRQKEKRHLGYSDSKEKNLNTELITRARVRPS